MISTLLKFKNYFLLLVFSLFPVIVISYKISDQEAVYKAKVVGNKDSECSLLILDGKYENRKFIAKENSMENCNKNTLFYVKVAEDENRLLKTEKTVSVIRKSNDIKSISIVLLIIFLSFLIGTTNLLTLVIGMFNLLIIKLLFFSSRNLSIIGAGVVIIYSVYRIIAIKRNEKNIAQKYDLKHLSLMFIASTVLTIILNLMFSKLYDMSVSPVYSMIYLSIFCILDLIFGRSTDQKKVKTILENYRLNQDRYSKIFSLSTVVSALIMISSSVEKNMLYRPLLSNNTFIQFIYLVMVILITAPVMIIISIKLSFGNKVGFIKKTQKSIE